MSNLATTQGDTLVTPKAQAAFDYHFHHSNENPYPKETPEWWDYEWEFQDHLTREMKKLNSEIQGGR